MAVKNIGREFESGKGYMKAWLDLSVQWIRIWGE